MPLDYVRVVAVRSEKTHLGGGDYAETEGQLPGSPFLARVYRDAQKVFDRDEAGSGNASVDRMPRLSVKDAACPVREGDVWLVPQPGGGTRRASVLLARRYNDRVQYDLEMGAEGDAGASNSGAAPGPLGSPPAPTAQAQIDALTAQLGALQMSFFLSQGPDPIVPISATSTLARPLVKTIYKVTPTANTVSTLFAATGSGLVVNFDLSNLGGFSFGIALAAGDAYDGNNAGVAAVIAQGIASGITVILRDVGAGVWHSE